jgi:hypothetical protein
MSIIAVRIKKGIIEFASDTQTTWGGNKYPNIESSDKTLKSFGKIFQVNGLTVGCAGDVAHIGLLQIFCKTSKPKETEKDSVIDWLISFKEWALGKAKINFADINVHGILAFEGKVFSFYDFMEVNQIKEFAAVGSVMFLAIGAMELGATASNAVKVAIKYDLFCGGDIKKIILK